MDFTPIQEIDSFEFDNMSIPIVKMKDLNAVIQFRDTTLPIVLSNLRPLEVVLAAVINEFAPLENLGLVSSMIASEREADVCLVPAFKIMLQYYVPERSYSNSHISKLVFDFEKLHEIVYSQMRKERIMEFYLRRKMTLIQDLSNFANLKFNMTALMSKAEEIISTKPKRDADEEFKGTGLVSIAK